MPYLANTNSFKSWVFLKMLQQSSCFALAQQQEQQEFWRLANCAAPINPSEFYRHVSAPFFATHAHCPADTSVAGENITKLAGLLNLSLLEQQLLALYYHLQADPLLAEFVRNCLPRPSSEAGKARMLADILGVNVQALQQVMQPGAALSQLGLLTHRVLHFSATALPSLELHDSLVVSLHFPQSSATALLRFALCELQQPALPLQQFSHVPFVAELRRVLKAAIAAGDKGFAILLHGPAGLGKTALVQSLAVSLKLTLCAVQHQDKQGGSLTAAARLSHFQLAQYAMAKAGGVILVDECSDILGDERNQLHFMQQPLSKLTINQLLEHTPVPAIFVCNSISTIDAAHLSRFSQIYTMPALSVAARERLLKQVLPRSLASQPALMANFAAMPGVSPRIIAQSVRFLTRAGTSRQHWPQRLQQHVQQQVLLQHAGQLQPQPLPGWVLPGHSIPACNTVAAGMRCDDKILLCGPAGSGKYTLARQLLAQQPFTEITETDLVSSSAEGMLQRLTQRVQLAAREQHALLLVNPALALAPFLADPQGALLHQGIYRLLLRHPQPVLLTHRPQPDDDTMLNSPLFNQQVTLQPWPLAALWPLAVVLCQHFALQSAERLNAEPDSTAWHSAELYSAAADTTMPADLATSNAQGLYPAILVNLARRGHWLGINSPAQLLRQALALGPTVKQQIGFVPCQH